MFISTNAIVVISIIIIIVIFFNIVDVYVSSINSKKTVNGKYILVGVGLVIISSLFLIGNIDYDKSVPVETYTKEDLDGSYQVGYEDGLADGTVDYTNIEDWFSSIENVTVNTGSENTIHIIDGNGEEWVLVADNNN